MGGIILILLIYFLGFKKYYICIKDTANANREELTKVLKYEFGMTLFEVERIMNNTPYDRFAGTFMNAYSIKKKLQKAGAEATLFMKPFWKKVEEGPRNELKEDDFPQVENPNVDAWQYINEAMELALSSGSGEEENLYLASVEEANRVDELLDKAEAAADDPLEDSYLEKVILLRHAVSYSLKRHWTHSWIIIGGVFLSIFVLATCNSDNQSAVSRAESRLYTVEHWVEADTVFESYPADIRYFNDINNPKHAKSDLLCRHYENYLRHTENAEHNRQCADTATVKSVKKDFLNSAKKEEELAKKSLKQYNKVNKMDFDDLQDYYEDICEDEVDAAEGSAFFLWFLLVVFVIMTPLYIMASYQYGHVIIKHQKEAVRLEKIKKAAFAVASALFGAGLAMQFFPSTTVKTYWSDGSTSTHTEENVFNYIIIALKVGLFILAVLVVCFVSCFLMTYMTITGLYRNYNWTVIYNDFKTRLQSLKK